ncbi:BTAD domain-containing putative transcriptional regulator [Cryptosporangium arvum]|uniref:BTAD domain-containing putative transcriptional regulator n=1 Tax=Cryptosporangium arvum TaxID=80871 RepID=UPI000562AA02
MRFGVLGPLLALGPAGPLDVKGPRHRAVLARLLVARGRMVTVDRLIDDLWGTAAPDGAVGAVQTFVAALRRALEPERAPRAPARVLVTSGPGYALRVDPDAVDALRFERAVTGSRDLLPAAALASLESALGEWRGPAYADFADAPWARAEATRLDELRLLAVERRADALLGLDRPAEAVPDLEAQVGAHPGREGAWRLYALALYRAGRQSDALAALRRARRILADSAGLDPGPGLRRLEADILAQSESLHLPAPAGSAERRPAEPVERRPAEPVERRPAEPAERRRAGSPPAERGPGPASAERGPGPAFAERGPEAAPSGGRGPVRIPVPPGSATGLVGRAEESAQLAAVAADVRARRLLRLALVSGEAGAGKSALVSTFAAGLAAAGWTTAWGTNPDDRARPDLEAWTQLLETVPGSAADPGLSRFERHRAVAARLENAARAAPLLVVVDDLQWAGTETLALLAAVVTEPPAGPVLVLATHRSTDVPPALTETLGRVARTEPARLYLRGLPAAEIPAVVRATIGRDVDAGTAATIHRRSGGNPFFVRELARLVADDGDLAAVPPGVRDVVRYRVAALPEPAQAVLRRAAVLGPDLDPALHTVLAGDADTVLDAVDAATAAGFLVERGPRRFTFAHALVRDALAGDVSAARRASWHAAAAAALETLRPDDVEALATHYVLADDPATAGRAVHYARGAAERAERRAAPADALRYWNAALEAFDKQPAALPTQPGATVPTQPAATVPTEPAATVPTLPAAAGPARAAAAVRTRLDLIMGTVRALALTGRLAAARTRRAEAVELAGTIGDPVLTAHVIGAFDAPALWPDADDPVLARHLAQVTERTLTALPAGRSADRSRLLATLALELRSAGGARAAAAAREAEQLARELGDPGVLAFALNARFMHSFGRAGLAPERARIGAELVALSERAELRAFEILGHLVLLQARSALADLTAADAHADTVDRLGERYQSPLVSVFTDWYRAMRASLGGRTAESASRYRAAAAHLGGPEMPGLDRGIAPLARFCEAVRRGEPLAEFASGDFGAFEPWVRPLLPGRGGTPEVPESPRDLLYEARTVLHALLAVRTGDRALMLRLHDALLPARDELAGAGSGMLTLAPVAHYLGDLAAALDRPDEAAAHHRHAARVFARASGSQR